MRPDQTPPVPRKLHDAYADWEWAVAYQGVPQVVTYRMSHPRDEVRYLKIADSSFYPSVSDEAARMTWARAHLPVPEVFESGSDHSVSWLITGVLPGVDATNAELREHPDRLVPTLAKGLRLFHQAPVAECPFDFRLDVALRHAGSRVAAGLIDPAEDFHPEHRHLSVDEALLVLQRTRPEKEDLVVCHGDYCFPNALIDGDRVVGFVDLGELGVADRWWDLAVATWSTTWNLGPGYEQMFLTAYGIEPDPARLAYYRLLYDLVS